MKEKNEYRYEFVNGDIVELRISRSGSVGDDKKSLHRRFRPSEGE